MALAGSHIYRDTPPQAKVEYFLRYLANLPGLAFLGNVVYVSGANFAFHREAFFKAGSYDVRQNTRSIGWFGIS
jgi:hypothetical protein